jgi:DNA-3-methyladenine glycosylase II
MPPSTRAASRALASTASSASIRQASPPRTPRKRKAKDANTDARTQASKRTKKDTDSSDDPTTLTLSLPPFENASLDASDAPKILPAALTFSFEDAKEHLIQADPRFAGLFARLGCKPFEQLERVEPFRLVFRKA